MTCIKKVSVIVPIYNGQKFINKCVGSLINQSYENIEIILINDGSTDDSLDLIKEYENKDKRIVIIDKKNEGVSVARNEGIKKATGQYIMFCDIDDWYMKDTIKIAVDNIKNYDMLKYNEQSVYPDGRISSQKIKAGLLENEQLSILIDDMLSLKSQGHASSYMYKSDIIKENNIVFKKNITYCEDLIFVINYLKYANDLVIIEDILYNYYQNNQSVTKNINSILKNLESFHLIYKELNELNKDISKNKMFLLNLTLIQLEKMANSKNSLTNLKKSCVALEDFFKGISLDDKSIKWKILSILILHKLNLLLYIYIKFYILVR